MAGRNCLVWVTFFLILALCQAAYGEPLPARSAPEPLLNKSARIDANAAGRARTEKVLALAIRHLGQADGWHVTETSNFRVLHNQSPSLAEKVARAAEQARTAAYDKWFSEATEDWQPRCELYLHANALDFHRTTGLPDAMPGVSTIHWDSGRALRRIDLRCDAKQWIEAVLPHEVTHAVLAGSFPEQRLAPWADEGIAVLAEPRSKVQLHLRNFSRYDAEDRLFTARQLIHLKAYPEPCWLGPFYAQSVSLVEFLASAKDPQTVIRFLHDGLRDGYETALQRHYGWDFNELDRRWRGYALSR